MSGTRLMSDPGGGAPSSTCPLANCSRALNAGGAIVFRERRGPLAPMRWAHIAGALDRSVLVGKRILSSSSQQALRMIPVLPATPNSASRSKHIADRAAPPSPDTLPPD
jgi:hypothetical protein